MKASTKKELREASEQLDQARKKVREIGDRLRGDPLLVSLKKAVAERTAYLQMIFASELESAIDLVSRLERELVDLQNSMQVHHPLATKEMIEAVLFTLNPKATIVWVSTNHRYLIVHLPGHRVWAGLGLRSYVGPQLRLYDVGKLGKVAPSLQPSVAVSDPDKGALSKANIEALIRKAPLDSTGINL